MFKIKIDYETGDSWNTFEKPNVKFWNNYIIDVYETYCHNYL